MCPTPPKLNQPPNAVEINPESSPMLTTLTEPTEKFNPSEKDKFSGSTEKRDATPTPLNPPLPKVTTKKSNKKHKNTSMSMEINPQESQELSLFPNKKPTEKLPLEEDLETDSEFTLD